MNNILVVLVVGVASLAVWLRIRKNVQGDHTQPWFTLLQIKETDPHTWWFDLLRQIEGDPMQDSGSGSAVVDAAVKPQPSTASTGGTDTPAKTPTPTATAAVEKPPPANPKTMLYLQWSTNASSSILRSDGLTPIANQVGNEVGWWEPVRQANIVNTFAVRGKDTTLDTIPIRCCGLEWFRCQSLWMQTTELLFACRPIHSWCCRTRPHPLTNAVYSW